MYSIRKKDGVKITLKREGGVKMYKDNRFFKGVSVIVSVLFLINNISFTAPDITRPMQKKSALKEMASAHGRTPGDIRDAFLIGGVTVKDGIRIEPRRRVVLPASGELKSSSAGISSLGVPAIGRLVDPGRFIEEGIKGIVVEKHRARPNPTIPLEKTLAFLEEAGGITAEACLRGADLGSSMDLGRGAGRKAGLKELVTPRGAKELADIAQTIVIPSKFRAKMRITTLTDKEKEKYGEGSIVYISELHDCPAEKPGIYKEPIELVDGKAPNKQADMVGYILWNRFGIHSVKVEFDVYYPGKEGDKSYGIIATKAGGMGTSGATNTLLYELGNMLSDARLTSSECASEAIDDENTVAQGYTGGQEGYVATAAEPEDNARAVDLVWIGGLKDAAGNYLYHPHSALSVPMLKTEEDVKFVEEHAVYLQIGARFEWNPEKKKFEKTAHRSASCINTGWMHSAETIRDSRGNDVPVDPKGADFHRAKVGFVKDMRQGLLTHDVTLINKGNMGHVDVRNKLSLREAQIIVYGDLTLGIPPQTQAQRLNDYSISDKIGLATYGSSDAEKDIVEAQTLPLLDKEKAGKTITEQEMKMLDDYVITNLINLHASNISLYSDYSKKLYQAIEEEMAENPGLSMSAFNTGAGGDGGIIMLWSSGGVKHIEDFLLRRLGIERFDAKEVVEITTKTGGTLAGWMPFEVGEIGTRIRLDKMTLEDAASYGFFEPEASPTMEYNEATGAYAKSSSAGITVEVNKVPAIFKFLDINQQDSVIPILTGTDGLRSDHPSHRLLAATGISHLDKDTISQYKNYIIPIFTGTDGLRSDNSRHRLLAAVGLSHLDKETASRYWDNIILVLTDKDGLQGFDELNRLLTTLSLSHLDKETVSRYRDNIIPILTGKDGLQSSSRWQRAVAALAISYLDKKTVSQHKKDIIPIFTGTDGLRSGDPWERLWAAVGITNLDKKTISRYKNEIIPIFTGTDGLRNSDSRYRLLSAVGMSNLDKDTIFQYRDNIIPIFTGKDGLRGDSPEKRLLAATGISHLDKDTISQYRDNIIPILTSIDGLRSNISWERLSAAAGLLLISKGETALKVDINYTGLKRPYTILAEDTSELADKLQKEVFTGLDISSKVLSDERIELSTSSADGRAIAEAVNIYPEGELEQALLRVLAPKVFTAIPKSSPAGMVDDDDEELLMGWRAARRHEEAMRKINEDRAEIERIGPEAHQRAEGLRNRIKRIIMNSTAVGGLVPEDQATITTLQERLERILNPSKSSSAGTFTGVLFDTGHKIAAREGVEFTPVAETPRTAVEVRELLKQAQKPLVIRAHLRGMDLCGSSLDLPEFQYSLTDQGVMEIKDIPSTPTLASEFTVKIRFELAKDPDVIEYIAPDYGITEDNPYIVKGKVELKDGRVPDGQKGAPAYIFANLFGLSGVRIICESISPMAMAGGMESSNAFNVALYAAASMLSGRNWTLADIFADSVRLENKELAGLTGGQGHLSSILGGAYHHIWQSGIKDAQGERINPYSAFSVPFINPEDFPVIQKYMALAQAGKEYRDGKAVESRASTLVNFMWTDLLRERDEIGVKLHREKLGLTARYINAVRNKERNKGMKTAVECIYRYVDIRDQLCVRWAECVLKERKIAWLHRLEPGDREVVATYGLDDAKKQAVLAEIKSGKTYNIERLNQYALENLQILYDNKPVSISLYSDTAKDLIQAARAEGIAVMPLGAGGPGAILGVVSSKGGKHLEKFFESQNFPLLTDDSVREVIRGTGLRLLKGYMPFKIGREPIQFEGFKELGLQEPALPVSAVYDEQTAKFATPKAASAGQLDLANLASLTPEALGNAIVKAKTEDVKRILIQSKLAAEVSKLDVSGTIVFNDEPLSAEQQQILKSILGKATPSLQELENLMNCTIRLKSELTPNDIKGELIIVSDTKLESFPDAKYLMFEQKVKLDNIYLPVVPMIAMAKGLLALKDMNQIELINSIKELSRSLCKKPLQDEIIETYIQNGIFNLELPKPEAYDYKKLEYMQRQALAALIAA